MTAGGAYDVVPEVGALYDAVPAYGVRRDVAFYVEEATRAGGPVLELGCGTGRITLPIARAGVAVTGLDASEGMLARCRMKLDAEPDAVRERVTLRRADARDFSLGATFALAIAPFRILQHVVAVDDQLRCLTSVARHVAPGGRLVLDVFNPSFAALTRDRATEQEDTAATLPDGRVLRRAIRVPRVRWTEQVSETELIYYVGAPGETPRRTVQAFDMRWYVPAELVHLLARTGFAVREILGDFDRSPLTDGSPEMIVRAERLTT